MSVCRSCRAPIWWGRTITGKLIPVDENPVDGGNLIMTGRRVTDRTGRGTVPQVRVETTAPLFDDDDGTRYISHFATCPNSDDWRAA